MNPKTRHRLTGAVVFIVSALQFLLTAQVSVSFWDPGELSAAAITLAVPHPPGGPLFSLVGHVLTMLPIPGDVGFRMNCLSVFASAFSVLLLYLVGVRLMNKFLDGEPFGLLTIASAAVGALALSFCGTFWFNGTESNYFAASTLLFSLIVWLMLVWDDRWDERGSWKYIVIIAYLVGLSAGVHLMSVLSLFAVVMLVVLRHTVDDDEACRKSAWIFAGHAILLLTIAALAWSSLTSKEPPTPEETTAYDNNAKLVVLAVSAAYLVLFRKQVFRRSSFYLALAVAGVALAVAYPGAVKLLPSLLETLAGDNSALGLGIFILLIVILAGVAVWAARRKYVEAASAAVAVIFIMLGCTTYTMTIIRANQHPPMNENDPNSFSRLVTYLNREQYGDFPEFKRRWSAEPQHNATWQNYSSDFSFFVSYQMYHMFDRYILWNFAGRTNYDQDAGVGWSQLFAVPFVIGIVGMIALFRRNWKLGAVFFILFLLMGHLTAYYQNQQQWQPRDRDYFYAGAYFVFALWIGIGVRELAILAGRKLAPGPARNAAVAVVAAAFILVPVRMATTNWRTHDRSKNWLPWDYAYNLLQSCATNAVLFTNGDNDTFPLWYLQEAEGIRQDIRIVNLSLANTDWYMLQLKHESPHGAAPVAMRLTDDQIRQLRLVQWEPRRLFVPVPPALMASEGVTDTADLRAGGISWVMPATLHYGDVGVVRAQDVLVKDIVEQNAWKRPIYFAGTGGEDARIGLGDYLRTEGLAARLVPRKRRADEGDYIDTALMTRNLMPQGEVISASYRPGFLYRGLNDPAIFYDENDNRSIQNYRISFIILATHYISQGNRAQCIATLDTLDRVIPQSAIPLDYRIQYNIAVLYHEAGATKQFESYTKGIEAEAMARIAENPTDASGAYSPYRVLTGLYELSGRYGEAADLLESLQKYYPGDPRVKNEITRYRALAGQKAQK